MSIGEIAPTDSRLLYLPKDLLDSILGSLGASSRAVCFSVSILFKKRVVEYETPLWIKFLAERHIKVLKASPREEAVAYIRNYCHFFYMRFPQVKAQFRTFPQNPFLAKDWIDNLDDIVSYKTVESIDLKEDAVSRQYLLEQDGGRWQKNYAVIQAVYKQVHSEEEIERLVEDLLASGIEVKAYTIIQMIYHACPEAYIWRLLPHAKIVHYEVLCDYAILQRYSEELVAYFLDKAATIKSCSILEAVNKKYSLDLVTRLMDKLAATSDGDPLFRLMELNYPEPLVIALLEKTRYTRERHVKKALESGYSPYLVNLLTAKLPSRYHPAFYCALI